MFSYLNKLFLVSLAIFLAGCMALPNGGENVNAPVSLEKGDANSPFVKSSSSLVQAVFANPEIARSFAEIEAAKSQVLILNVNKASKIDLSGSTGLTSSNNLNAVGGAVATIKAHRLLFDNGQTDRSILLSKLQAQSKTQAALITIDESLQKILTVYIEQTTSKEVIKIIDYYLDLYNEQENLILSAVQVGVLSKSDYLEIKSLKNDTLSQRARAELSISKADSFFKEILGTNSDIALSDLSRRHENWQRPILDILSSPQKNLIDLQISRLNVEIEIQRERSKPISRWEASISSPKTNSSDTTLFAGVTVSLPIKDGGDALARIEAFSRELVVAELGLEVLTNSVALSKSSLVSFANYYQKQKNLLIERNAISAERIVDLELRLKAGRSNVNELTKEILAGANIEISLAQLDAEYSLLSVQAAAAVSQTCGILMLCELINKPFLE
tara:strand:+ start:751 stop:2085 length:1335 start_codon:yes stop_codon:yes gene_type:complete